MRKFVDLCVKTSVVSLIRRYEFKTTGQTAETDLEVLSCRLSALTKSLPLTADNVERREKASTFEQSLKEFYASKDVSFLSTIGL